jgi:hypothetical protein
MFRRNKENTNGYTKFGRTDEQKARQSREEH